MNVFSNFIYKIYNIFFHNKVEKKLFEIFLLLKINKVGVLNIVDIGCFKAYFSKKLKKYFKNFNTKFYLFDPNPKLETYLNKEFIFENIAISNVKSATKKIFYFNKIYEGSGSSLKSTIANEKIYNFSRRMFFFQFKSKLFKKIIVNVKTLNYVIDKYKLKKIFILKIDAESSELQILLSGKKYLQRCVIIYVEISDLKIKWSSKFNTIYNLLNNLGFDLYFKKEIIEGSLFSKLKFADCIFVNKKLI